MAIAIKNHAPITRIFHQEYYLLSETEKSMHRATKIIPASASVSAQQPFVSHLSGRSEIYWFPKNINQTDYSLVVDSRPASPLSNEERDRLISDLIKDNQKKLLFSENGVYLYQKINFE